MSRKLLMVVDDSAITRKLFCNKLFTQNYNIITAQNGEEAMEILEYCIPDAIFVDLRMPKVHGLKLSEWIRSTLHLQHLPVYIISSFSETDSIAEAVKKHNIQGWFPKPFDFNEIIKVLETRLT